MHRTYVTSLTPRFHRVARKQFLAQKKGIMSDWRSSRERKGDRVFGHIAIVLILLSTKWKN